MCFFSPTAISGHLATRTTIAVPRSPLREGRTQDSLSTLGDLLNPSSPINETGAIFQDLLGKEFPSGRLRSNVVNATNQQI